MNIKNFIVAIAIVASASLAQAGVVFDNGGPAGDSFRCISGPDACGGSGTWTIYDQFTLNAATTVSGFANWNYEYYGGAYASTNWSIWTSTPTNGGSALYSGSSTATISSDQGSTLASVNGLSISLAAGTYWLGINHTVNDGIWTYAFSSNGISDAIQLDGDTVTNPDHRDMAFTISAVPEPETYAMLLAGLGILGFAARRKRTAA